MFERDDGTYTQTLLFIDIGYSDIVIFVASGCHNMPGLGGVVQKIIEKFFLKNLATKSDIWWCIPILKFKELLTQSLDLRIWLLEVRPILDFKELDI